MKYKIIALGSGGLSGLSGVHEYLFSTLAKKHDIVEIIDTGGPRGFWKYWNALYCFWRLPGFSKYLHPVRTILGEEVGYCRARTKYYILKRTAACESKIRRITDYDIALQTTWIPVIRSKPTKPRFIYIDFTMRMAEREWPPGARFLSNKDKSRWLKLETESYRNATTVFSASNHTRNSLINDYGVDSERVVTVYEGVNVKDLPTFEKSYDSKTILFVGILFDQKGGQTLIKAFKEVKKEIKDAKLVIAGSTPPVNENDIIVKGYISRNELLQLYEDSSVFAMPSICEAFGLVFLEAMAYKTPCIGTTVDAMPEIIEDGRTGFLVPPNDYKQLADKLILLLEDENLMKRMGEQGRERVEKYFTWDLVVDRMTQQFEKNL